MQEDTITFTEITIVKLEEKEFRRPVPLPYYFMDSGSVYCDETNTFGVLTNHSLSYFTLGYDEEEVNENQMWHIKHNGKLRESDSWIFKSGVMEIDKGTYHSHLGKFLAFLQMTDKP